jgi:succinyl-CoA synthetase alpha subunit
MLRVRQQLAGTGTRLIGPNTPGLIIPGRIKIGIMPGDVFTPGPVAVLSRSGTLTYESVFRLTRAGIGQSACVGIGGDPFVGSSFRDIAKLLLDDPATKALLVLGEIGGRAEEELGEYLNKKGFDRPLFGFIAGQTAPPGKRLGHAGAILEDNAGIEGKLKKMHETGYTVCPDLTSISERIGRILA